MDDLCFAGACASPSFPGYQAMRPTIGLGRGKEGPDLEMGLEGQKHNQAKFLSAPHASPGHVLACSRLEDMMQDATMRQDIPGGAGSARGMSWR